jgi:hypothetical protein
MGDPALVVFIMGLCDVRFSAFPIRVVVGDRRLTPRLARRARGLPLRSHRLGGISSSLTFFTALPGLAMVWWQRARIATLEQRRDG